MILLLLACDDAPTPLPPPASVWVEARRVDVNTAVRIHAPASTPMPTIEGLTLTPVSTGDDGSAIWDVTGEEGSYILDVPTTDGAVVPVYVDIGVDGPTGGTMADLAGPRTKPAPVWPYLLAGLLGLGTLIAATFAAWNRWKPIPPPPPAEPPDVIARREWAALRARMELPPADLALALSAVYRRYLDAVHVWPASSRTTREILDNLAGDLSASDLDCARRLLSAMDLVKFADREAQRSLFEQLDTDFHTLLAPRRLGAGRG